MYIILGGHYGFTFKPYLLAFKYIVNEFLQIIIIIKKCFHQKNIKIIIWILTYTHQNCEIKIKKKTELQEINSEFNKKSKLQNVR